MHIIISDDFRKEFIEGYQTNKQFKTIYEETSKASDARSPG